MIPFFGSRFAEGADAIWLPDQTYRRMIFYSCGNMEYPTLADEPSHMVRTILSDSHRFM